MTSKEAREHPQALGVSHVKPVEPDDPQQGLNGSPTRIMLLSGGRHEAAAPWDQKSRRNNL